MKYTPEIVDKIRQLIAYDSYTIAEVCQIVGISQSTFFDWKANKLEFSEAIKKAKQELDHSVFHDARKSIRKIIRGYEWKEVHTETRTDKEGNRRVVSTRTVTRHVPPNSIAIIFTLKQDGWKDAQQQDVNLQTNISFAKDDGVE